MAFKSAEGWHSIPSGEPEGQMTLPSFSNYLLHVGSNVGSEGKADAFANILNPVPGWFGVLSQVLLKLLGTSLLLTWVIHKVLLSWDLVCLFFLCWINIFSASDLASISILSFSITMSVRLDSQLGMGQNHALRIIQLVGIQSQLPPVPCSSHDIPFTKAAMLRSEFPHRESHCTSFRSDHSAIWNHICAVIPSPKVRTKRSRL